MRTKAERRAGLLMSFNLEDGLLNLSGIIPVDHAAFSGETEVVLVAGVPLTAL